MGKIVIAIISILLVSNNAFCASAARKTITQNFFVSHGASASDNNGGTNGASPSDETTNGAPLENGTTATTSSGVLTDLGATFSSNGVTAAAVGSEGDYVQLVSGTGITPGLYKITALTETTLTLATDPGDSAAGDIVYNVGGSFATIQKACDLVPAPGANNRNFRINIKSDSTYTLSSTIDIDTAATVAYRCIWVEGYDTTVGDIMDGTSDDLVEIDGDNSATYIFNISKGVYRFVGLECHNSTDVPIYISNAAADYTFFFRCNFHSPTGANKGVVYVVSGADYAAFVECLIYGPTGNGDSLTVVGTSYLRVIQCYIRCSASAGSYCLVSETDQRSFLYKNIFDGNNGLGAIFGGFLNSLIANNTFYDCYAGIQYRYTTYIGQIVIDNVFESADTYGIDGTSNTGSYEIYGHNSFYNNTSGDLAADAVSFCDMEQHQTPTATVYVDPENYDFDINNTASAGQDIQGAGFGKYLYDSTVTTDSTSANHDIGGTAYEGASGGGGSSLSVSTNF